MKQIWKSTRFALIAAALAVLVTLLLTTNASHQWGTYHWARTSNPFTLRVGNNVSSAWTTAYNTTLSDWSASSVLNLATESGSAGRNFKAVTGTIQVSSAKYGNNGWLGLATINITNVDHITKGTAKMNDTYFNTSYYNNPNEKQHVMCQEVGHTFGLGHTSEDGSSQNTCMDYFSNTGANAGSTLSTHPNAHDYALLESMYAHLDGFTTVGFASSASSQSGENPNDWGNLMSQSANGLSSTYVKDFINGSRVVTHIFWTEERAETCRGCDHRFHD